MNDVERLRLAIDTARAGIDAVKLDRDESVRRERAGRPACPACGGPLAEIRAKLVCARCHTICETCCEGGRG
jgi:hypothetical protein